MRADDDVVRWLAEVATHGDPGQAPLTTQAQRGSNWKWWKRYCAYLGLSSPWRPDAATLDADGQQREAAIWAPGRAEAQVCAVALPPLPVGSALRLRRKWGLAGVAVCVATSASHRTTSSSARTAYSH